MSFQETYFLDDDLNLTTKESPKKKKVKTKESPKKKKVKKIKKLSPKKDNWKINFKSYQEPTEEIAAIPIPAVSVPVVPVFKSKKSKKNVSLQVQANGYLLGEEGLELECKYCRPYMQFDSLINFVCHMLKEHENGYIFKCTTCNGQFTGSTIASHLRDHTKTTVSLFFAPCEEHSWYNSEPTEGVDDSCDSSDNEVLSKLKLEYDSADANTDDGFDTDIKEENGEEGEEIFVGPRSFHRLILNSRTFYVEKRFDDGRFICRNCNSTFESILNAMQHMVHDHKGEDPPYTIKTLPKNEPETNDTITPTPPANADELPKPVDNLLCSECGKEFKRSADLKKHLRVHTGEKPFKCTLCDKDFSTNSGLNRHTLIHTGEKPYLCNTCGKAFNNPGTLKDHSMQHLTDKFDCQFCGKQYTTLTYLRVHLRGAHSREMGKTDQKGYGPFICDVCNKELSSSVSLNTHMRIHTKERPFQCSLCPKNFSHRGTFNHHILEHSEDKRYKCSECGKGFHFEKKLTEHLRKHTGEKPYQCQLCDKAFRSMSSLCNHRKYDHFGAVKPAYKYKQTFPCEVCLQKFDSKSQLRDHMNLHTCARKYCCSFCSKSYKMRSSLRTHMATKHAVQINMADFTRKRGPTEARKDFGSRQYLLGHSR